MVWFVFTLSRPGGQALGGNGGHGVLARHAGSEAHRLEGGRRRQHWQALHDGQVHGDTFTFRYSGAGGAGAGAGTHSALLFLGERGESFPGRSQSVTRKVRNRSSGAESD